jgi:hypothetical protein
MPVDVNLVRCGPQAQLTWDESVCAVEGEATAARVVVSLFVGGAGGGWLTGAGLCQTH